MISPKSANQLYKEYKDAGGQLGFIDFINREKEKGTFPVNEELDKEVQQIINDLKTKNNVTTMEGKTVLGLPIKTLLIAGAIITGGIIVSIILKQNKS